MNFRAFDLSAWHDVGLSSFCLFNNYHRVWRINRTWRTTVCQEERANAAISESCREVKDECEVCFYLMQCPNFGTGLCSNLFSLYICVARF